MINSKEALAKKMEALDRVIALETKTANTVND